jgi:hypothetical protein
MTLLLPAYNKLIGGGGPIFSSSEFLAMGGTDTNRTLDIELPVDGLLVALFTYRQLAAAGCIPRIDGVNFGVRRHAGGGGVSVEMCADRASAGTRTISMNRVFTDPEATDLAWYLLPYDDGLATSFSASSDRDPTTLSSTADAALSTALTNLSSTAHNIVAASCFRDNATPPDVLSLTGWSSYEDLQFDAGPRGISASLSVSAPINPGPSAATSANSSDGFAIHHFSLRPYDATLTI